MSTNAADLPARSMLARRGQATESNSLRTPCWSKRRFGQAIARAASATTRTTSPFALLFDAELRQAVNDAIARARQLRATTARPPVTENERLCARCSLAEVCLPRRAVSPADPDLRPIRLLPEPPEGRDRARHGPRSKSWPRRQRHHRDREGRRDHTHPDRWLGEVVLHGFSQISTQGPSAVRATLRLGSTG